MQSIYGVTKNLIADHLPAIDEERLEEWIFDARWVISVLAPLFAQNNMEEQSNAIYKETPGDYSNVILIPFSVRLLSFLQDAVNFVENSDESRKLLDSIDLRLQIV